MDWIPLVSALVGGLGIGSIITSVINHFLSERRSNKERVFTVKKEAYLGLLDALHAGLVDPKRRSDHEHWRNVVGIVGSPEVWKNAEKLVTSRPKTEERDRLHIDLLNSMRTDLGIYQRELKING